MSQNQKSEIEVVYERMQEQCGGNISWYEIPREWQDAFIQAINTIIQITSQRK